MYERHGEQLPNGLRVGDLVTYTGLDGPRYGVVLPTPERWTGHSRLGLDGHVWCVWADDEARALDNYRRYDSERPFESYRDGPVTLIRHITNEGSNTVSIQFRGETLSAEDQPVEVVAGRQYRLVYPQDHHNFEFIGTAMNSERVDSANTRFEIVRWVHENNGWNSSAYNVGYVWNAVASQRSSTCTCLILPYSETETPASSSDSAYDGTPGEFEPHDGHAPEPGTIVRGFSSANSSRQVEGVFLRLTGSEARVDRKRKRTKRADGTFSSWETYTVGGSVSVAIEGATIFKPGASATSTPGFTRTTPITSREENATVTVGMILSARGVEERGHIYRGEVTEVGTNGRFTLNATHYSVVRDSYSTSGSYAWLPMASGTAMLVIADWSEGRERWDRAGWLWERLAPGQKPVDPAYDPKRKTPFTGMKIGDIVVGLRVNGGRDTVSSWARGELVKWNVREGNPIIKVTDPMESGAEVGKEVTLYRDDTYPALADPKNSDPEEFKKVLRAYLIGRHKRSDMCRGGLNTMLAAFGLPLYETRRRAVMNMTVEYDPNEVDLYSVQQNLRRGLPGVSGLSFSEQSGEDVELSVQSDISIG
jgi:hypothetical protein